MEERPGRSLAAASCAARWALAVALAALAATALRLPWQRSPVPLALVAALVLAAAIARPVPAILLAVAAVALLPVFGNLLVGPWVAPAELLLLLLAAATVWRKPGTGTSPLKDALVLSVAAVAAGGLAATVGALAPSELPGALRELAASFFSPGAEHAALPLRAALVHSAGLLGFLLFRRVSLERGVRAPLGALVAGLALVGAYGLLEASTGLKLWSAVHYEALSSGLRVPASLPDYNATGAAMGLGLFPAAVLAREARGGRRLAWGGATAFLLAGLLLSGSRSAWLATAFAAGLALAGVLWSRRTERGAALRRLLLGAGIVAGGVVVAIGAWPGDVGELLRRRAASLVDPKATLHAVRAGRLGFWAAGVRMVEAHPLAGVGPGRVPARFDEFRDPAFPGRAENLHNYFLQSVAENGIPGGLLVLLPFAALAVVAGRLLANGASLAAAPAALAPGLLAFSVTGLASHPWLLPEMQLLFWGAAALLPAGLPASEPARPPGRVRRFVPGAVLAAWCGALLLLVPGVSRGRWVTASGDRAAAPNAISGSGPERSSPLRSPREPRFGFAFAGWARTSGDVRSSSRSAWTEDPCGRSRSRIARGRMSS